MTYAGLSTIHAALGIILHASPLSRFKSVKPFRQSRFRLSGLPFRVAYIFKLIPDELFLMRLPTFRSALLSHRLGHCIPEPLMA